MATQEIGADGGHKFIVLGGPVNIIRHFEQIRKVKNAVTILPGNFVSTNGETEGEVDLAAAGDGAVAAIELCIQEEPYPSSLPTDGSAIIDQGIVGVTATPTFILTLRPTGLFRIACIRADESNAVVLGQPMALEATGHCQLLDTLYVNATYATDMMVDFVGRCANVTTDVAGTDLVQELFY